MQTPAPLRGAGASSGRLNGGQYLDGTVVVAVTPMRMVQMTINKVIGMVAVRNGLMTAAGTVDMPGSASVNLKRLGAAVGVLGADRKEVLVDMCFMRMMKVAVVQVVGVPVVLDCDVAASGSVLMWMTFVNNMLVHDANTSIVETCLLRIPWTVYTTNRGVPTDHQTGEILASLIRQPGRLCRLSHWLELFSSIDP